MRIAISGTHFTGKTTLIEDIMQRLPDYEWVEEPYYLLEEEGYQFPETPLLEDYEKQLSRSIQLLRGPQQNIIFDRCPLDFIAYSLSVTDSDYFNIDSWLPALNEALNSLDLIFFLPVEQGIPVPASQNNDFRRNVDDQLNDIFHNNSLGFNVKVVTIQGSREKRAELAMEHIRRLRQ
ncbi:MAG TPA: AAA family ATPase [Bacteroidia bacterium]|nr:AAA family ATPase [Bacteroidia bacterium]